MVSSTHPTICLPRRLCNDNIAGLNGPHGQHTTQGPPERRRQQQFPRVNINSTASLSQGAPLGCSGQRATLPFYAATSGPDRLVLVADLLNVPTGRQAQDFRAMPLTSATAHSLTPSYSCLSALPMSHKMPSTWFAKALPTDGASRSLLSGAVLFTRVSCDCPPTPRPRKVSAAS